MTDKDFRKTVGYLHVAVGVMLILFVYSPLSDVGWYALTVQVLAIPLVSLSGIALWQQPKLNARLKRLNRST